MGEFKLPIDKLVHPLSVPPGTELTFSGSYRTQDGATLDAATTTWPAGESGPAGVDAGGIIDFAAGGLRMVSRDPTTHEVVAIVTGDEGPVCKALGTKSPCLVLRTVPLSRTRLVTVNELTKSMMGGITVKHFEPPPPPPPSVLAPAADLLKHPATISLLAVSTLAGVGALAWVIRRRQQLSAEGQLRALTKRVQAKLQAADAALVATLTPALKRVVSSVSNKKLDAQSPEAERVKALLLRIESSIEDSQRAKENAKQQAAADELVIEMEAAMEAAEETMRAARHH